MSQGAVTFLYTGDANSYLSVIRNDVLVDFRRGKLIVSVIVLFPNILFK